MDLEVSGNTALVTASSSGLGKAAAKSFVEEGANVAVCGRDESRLEDARAEIDAAGPGDVLAVPTDLTVEAEVEALVEETVAEYGSLDHLVLSAGRVEFGPFSDLSPEDWDDAHDVLVMSAVYTVDAARSRLEESDAGTVVTITSASVQEPMENLTLSNSIRRGVLGLTKTLADELAPDVRVNAVLPYHHVSEEDLDEFDDATVEAWYDEIPLEMVGDPKKLGEICAFLSSPRTEYVTGASIPVDGGWLRS